MNYIINDFRKPMIKKRQSIISLLKPNFKTLKNKNTDKWHIKIVNFNDLVIYFFNLYTFKST